VNVFKISQAKAIWQLRGRCKSEYVTICTWDEAAVRTSNIRLLLPSNVYVTGTSVVERIGLTVRECRSRLTSQNTPFVCCKQCYKKVKETQLLKLKPGQTPGLTL